MFCSVLGLTRLSGACYFREVQVKTDGTGPGGFFDLLIGARGTEINYNYILALTHRWRAMLWKILFCCQTFVLLITVLARHNFKKIFRHCLNG